MQSRRRFLRNAFDLASIAFVASVAPTVFSETETRIDKALKKGIIEGEVFYLDQPFVLAIDNVQIRNCSFIAKKPLTHLLELNGNNCHLISCHFESRGSSTAIIVPPNKKNLVIAMNKVFT